MFRFKVHGVLVWKRSLKMLMLCYIKNFVIFKFVISRFKCNCSLEQYVRANCHEFQRSSNGQRQKANM